MRPLYRWLSAALILAVAACSDAGPSTDAEYFTATLDGASWPVDTAVSLVYATLCDTSSLVAAPRGLIAQQLELLSIYFRHYPAVGQYVLGDSSSGTFATFSTGPTTPGPRGPRVAWYSLGDSPGTLHISAVDRSDSVLTGTFAFDAATIPDTAPRHHLAGRFKVRFTLQPVYVVACPAAPRRPDPSGRMRPVE